MDRLDTVGKKSAAAAGALAVLAGAGYFLKSVLTRPGDVGAEVPETMKAVMLLKHVPDYSASDLSEYVAVQTIPTPKPGPGEILVRLEAAAVNPSDLSTLQGSYNSAQRESLPCQLGYEGSGTVLASGGGFMGRRLLGKRVAVVSTKGGRTWAEYGVFSAMQALPLPADVTYEEGCSTFVNPLTVLGFLETVEEHKCKAVVHTAGGSALGKMLIRMGAARGISVIPVVRRSAVRDELIALGAKTVIVTSEDGWKKDLHDVCESEKCTIAFDAVAGPTTGDVLRQMPPKSTVYVYGGLSQQSSSNIRPTELIFRQSVVKGWWLTPRLRTKGMLGMYKLMSTVSKHLKVELHTDIRQSYALDDAASALAEYGKNMSAGKIAFAPHS